MQHSPYEIKEKLLQALDQEYNVVDMAAVFEVITALEKAIITKEALERTRIGKYINELRKKTNNEQLARRAKDLVKSWRKLLPQSGTRVNGEDVISNISSSPGRITVLGPGPGPGFGPGPGPGNRTFKCVSLTGAPKYKSSSPSLERSSSPFFSSASNSPLYNSQGSNMPLASSNYAPVKFSANQRTTPRAESNSVKSLLNLGNQSKVTSSQIFKPISPTLATDRHKSNSLLSRTNLLPSQRSCSPNVSPELQPNSCSSSPLSPSMNLHPRPTSVPVTYGSSSSHSTLDIAKTNVANKRLRKEEVCSTFSNNCATSKELKANSKSSIGNGTSIISESILPSSAFKSVNLSNFKSADESDKKSIVTNLKPRKRKRSFDKNELETTLDGALASVPSGSKLPKVKTTQQLIAELQAKKGGGFDNMSDNEKKKYGALSPDTLASIDHPFRSSEAEVSRTKSELLKKFLISSQSARQDINQECPTGESSISLSQSNYSSHSVLESNSVISTNKEFQASAASLDPVDVEVNRILSALPPLNMSEINLEDDAPSPTKPVPVTIDVVNRLSEPWEYVNGVYDCHGTWRPWQECSEQVSYLGETLRILPYVNID